MISINENLREIVFVRRKKLINKQIIQWELKNDKND